MNIAAVLAPVTAIIALLFAYGLSSWIGKMDEGTERMKEISDYISEGAFAFLRREYKTMVIVILVLFIILGFGINWTIALLYVLGALFSISASYFGMRMATKGNVRTVSAAMNQGMNQALKVAFRSGAVMGLCLMGFGLLGIGGVFVILGLKTASVITGFALGASTMALFGRSMGFDLFESYAGSIISVIILAAVTKSINPKFGYPFDLPALEGSVFPLILSAIGILASILGIMFVRGSENKSPAAALKTGTYINYTVFLIFSLILSRVFFGNFNCAISVAIGLIAGMAIRKITEIYTSADYKHVKTIAEKSQTGHAAAILSGYGIGLQSTVWTILIFAAGILVSHAFTGLYGITLAAVGFVSAAGMIMAIDAIENKASNTGNIFSISSAAITAIALLVSYFQITELKAVSIMKPTVLAGLLLGAMLPFLFAALTTNFVGKATNRIMVVLGFLAMIIPFAVGILLGTETLGGMLAGSSSSGVLLAILMTNAGGAWANTKTYIEEGNYGGIGGDAHKAAMVGDTVGDSFRNTVSPSINILIKLMAIVAVLFAPIFAEIGGLL